MRKKLKGTKAAEEAEFNALLQQLATVSQRDKDDGALAVTAVDSKKSRQKKAHDLKEAKLEADFNRKLSAQMQRTQIQQIMQMLRQSNEHMVTPKKTLEGTEDAAVDT